MSDLTIVGIVVGTVALIFFIGCWKIGRRLAVHLNAPPRSHDRTDKDIDKIIEDRVAAALARRGAH